MAKFIFIYEGSLHLLSRYERITNRTMNPILSSFIQERPLTTGGLTFYLLNGKLASRPAKNRKRTRRDRSGNVLPARSPAQVQVNDRFRDTRRFARVGRLVRERVGAWRIAAAGTGKTGDNLFHAVNGKACEGGKVVDFAEFHFSVGTLSIPRELRVTREGWRVHLRWEDGRDQPVAAPTDRVMIGYFHDTLPDSPQVFEGPTATRADGECTITIDPAEGRDLHLHVFMARADGTAYSSDRYFFLPAGSDSTGESLSTGHPGGDEPKASGSAPVVPIHYPCSPPCPPVRRGTSAGDCVQYRRFVSIPGEGGVLHPHGPPGCATGSMDLISL